MLLNKTSTRVIKLYPVEYKKKMLAYPTRISHIQMMIPHLDKLARKGDFIAFTRLIQEKDLLNFLNRNITNGG